MSATIDTLRLTADDAHGLVERGEDFFRVPPTGEVREP